MNDINKLIIDQCQEMERTLANTYASVEVLRRNFAELKTNLQKTKETHPLSEDAIWAIDSLSIQIDWLVNC